MENNNHYDRLVSIQKEYPELTFDNKGFEYIKPHIRETHKEQIEEIGKILKEVDSGFVKFFNFKPRANSTFSVRYDTYYDPSFIGVRYIDIEDFKN